MNNDNVNEQVEKVASIWRNFPHNHAESLWNSYSNSPASKITTNTFLAHVRRFLKPGSSILDIGGGAGELSLPLYDEGYHVSYIDISKEMVNRFLENKGSRNINIYYKNVIDYIPDNNVLFDGIVSRYVFSHYPQLAPLLRKCSSLLNRGGYLIFDHASGDSIKEISGLFNIHEDKLTEKYSFCPNLIRKKDIEILGKDAGFNLIAMTSPNIFVDNLYFGINFDTAQDYRKAINEHLAHKEVINFINFLQNCCLSSPGGMFSLSTIVILRKNIN